jgi:Na+/H+ antiporter NhaD/arsenite permease-like protein
VKILITQILDIPAVPILILEAIFSNIGGTATLIGDPPNIIIGSKAHLHFIDFIKALSPPILIITIISYVIGYFMIRKHSRISPTAKMIIKHAQPEKAILNPQKLKISLFLFFVTLIGFFVSHIIHLKPGIVALIGASLMAIFTKTNIEHMLEKIEWTTIIFFAGLFMLIGAMEYNHVFDLLGKKIIGFTEGNLLLTCMIILWASAFLSAIVDNIPLVIALIPLIQSIIPEFSSSLGLNSSALIKAQIEMPLYWSLALGSCLGGNGSMIGASANVVVSQIAKANRYKMSFWDFTKVGLGFMLLSVTISSFYIYFAYFFK